MCFEIGFLIGFWEFLNHEGISQIQEGRIELAKSLLPLGPAGIVAAYFCAYLDFEFRTHFRSAYVSLAILATVIGSLLCVYVSPIAKGGGIAEVKAFLNGVKFSQLLHFRALSVKLISTMCSVGAGLAVGQVQAINMNKN
jgi:H+/Cl- antiporter ClcA